MEADEPHLEQAAAVVAAHPDDEVIGAGALLPQLASPTIIHVTDGAPRNGADAHAAGFDSPKAYAEARRRELLGALGVAGIGPERAYAVGLPDQEASLHLAELARRLVALFRVTQPAIVFTHPYEGGHPDHDATAFAVHAAARLMDGLPRVYEFTSYHASNGSMVAGEFLPAPIPGGGDPSCIRLNDDARLLKQRMFDCFVTQRHVLASFPISVECFRPAPLYDFTQPPHAGQLYYERFDWGMTGARWRTMARQALTELQIRDLI